MENNLGRGSNHTPERLCYTVPEAAQLLGISRNNGYALAKSGELPTVRLRKRILVPKVRLHQMLGDYPDKGGEN